MINEPEKAHQTAYTRTGKVNMINRKPYRTKSQKETASRMASIGKDGAWHSAAPLSFHSRAKDSK